jgi:hypothetical protein
VDAACKHPAVIAAYGDADHDESTSTHCCGPAAMPHVMFSSEENQQVVQRCTAVFGRVPFLAVVDMRDDDDEHCFLLELKDMISGDDHALMKAVVDFFVRVGRGTEPRCRQGAAPPPQDVFEPTHGAVLCEARAAVTSTFSRLLDTANASRAPCGALCVFWSDRCPCCPGVLMLIEAIVKLIRLVAAHHAEHPSDNVSFVFPFLVANIDDNDFTQREWPVAEREQVVPSLVAYPAPSFTPVLFTGERLPTRLASFICEHCLPSAELVACTPHITEEVAKVASRLSIDQLMTVLEEGSPGYAAATQAYADFTQSAATVESVERLYASLNDVRNTFLPFSLEKKVRRMSAEDGAAAAGSQGGGSLVGDEDGGEEAEADVDGVEAKGGGWAAAAGASTTPVPAAPISAVTNSFKRSRESRGEALFSLHLA